MCIYDLILLCLFFGNANQIRMRSFLSSRFTKGSYRMCLTATRSETGLGSEVRWIERGHAHRIPQKGLGRSGWCRPQTGLIHVRVNMQMYIYIYIYISRTRIGRQCNGTQLLHLMYRKCTHNKILRSSRATMCH